MTYSEDGDRIAPQEMLKELRFVIDEQNLTTEIGGQKSISTDKFAQGKVTFNAPKLYIGSVTFEARKYEGTWRIEKFHLPSRQISIELGEDGSWHPEGKEAEGNQAPAHSTPNETPES